jgi:hypothetical protein
MNVYLDKRGGRLVLTAHGGGDGQPSATYVQDLEPGCRDLGRTYEEWAALPQGVHEVPDDFDPDEDYPPPGVGEPA